PSGGFDGPLEQRSRQATAYLFGDAQLSEWLNLGAGLSFIRGEDDLQHGGNVESDTWQAGLYALLSNAGPLWLSADLSAGRTRFDLDRSVFIQGNAGGPALLDQKLAGETDATFWGAGLLGGYDLPFGDWRTGPQVGLDYRHYRLDGFSERSTQRTALSVKDDRFDSLELSLGWQVRGNVALDRAMRLQPYASLVWIEELGDGMSEDFTVTSLADGSARRVSNGRENDKHFARARLGTQLAISEAFAVYAEANTRLRHADGDQASYSLGLQYLF
ncbi:autotransporter domain-containing protein, partial [Pseudomonas sp. Bi70]